MVRLSVIFGKCCFNVVHRLILNFRLQNVSATKIQAVWRGHRVRHSYRNHRHQMGPPDGAPPTQHRLTEASPLTHEAATKIQVMVKTNLTSGLMGDHMCNSCFMYAMCIYFTLARHFEFQLHSSDIFTHSHWNIFINLYQISVRSK